MEENILFNRKAQIWFTDFAIAIIIFSFALISYYTYATNISRGDSIVMDNLVSDAKTISSSLVSAGYPAGWDSTNVIRIGFTSGNNRIDNAQFNEFMEINYNKTRKMLGTSYDYLLFFVNESGDVQNIEGFCGTGNFEFNATYDISAAYYYKNEENLKQFMIDTFDADIYSPLGPDISALIANINNYGLVVIESPEFSASTFNDIEDDIEIWAGAGGTFMLGGRPTSSNGVSQGDMLGVKFLKMFGDAERDKVATAVREDNIVNFDYGGQIKFSQVYGVEDISIGPDFLDIARFNESDIEIADILDNTIAVARWTYGTGNAVFFSDFDAQYLSGDFQNILENSVKKVVGRSRCLPVNISNIGMENLVKAERLLSYNSKPVKMVMYLWN